VTYAHVVDVAAPVELYDTVHAEVVRASGGKVDGLLVHVGRATAAGFQVLEVWESREHFERYNADVVLPAAGRLVGAGEGPELRQDVTEFEVRGLVLSGGDVVA
jgi:hypothetical protein